MNETALLSLRQSLLTSGFEAVDCNKYTNSRWEVDFIALRNRDVVFCFDRATNRASGIEMYSSGKVDFIHFVAQLWLRRAMKTREIAVSELLRRITNSAHYQFGTIARLSKVRLGV